MYHHIRRVVESPVEITRSELVAAVAIAYGTDKSDVAWISQEQIARLSRLSRPTVIRTIKSLEGRGLLTVGRMGYLKKNMYLLRFPLLPVTDDHRPSTTVYQRIKSVLDTPAKLSPTELAVALAIAYSSDDEGIAEIGRTKMSRLSRLSIVSTWSITNRLVERGLLFMASGLSEWGPVYSPVTNMYLLKVPPPENANDPQNNEKK